MLRRVGRRGRESVSIRYFASKLIPVASKRTGIHSGVQPGLDDDAEAISEGVIVVYQVLRALIDDCERDGSECGPGN